jgi:hypothetical protein
VLYLYLFSAVAGLLLVGVSMAGVGSHGDGADGGDGDGAADSSHALSDGSSQHEAGGGQHQLQPGQATGGLGSAALLFFSLQVWTYLLAFGGLTGLLLRTLAHVGEPVAGLCALSVGLGTAAGARRVLRRMTALGDSGTVEAEKLVGTSAQVLIPAGPGGTGKIRLLSRGQTIDMMARSHEGGTLSEGQEVVILEIGARDGVALVTPELPDLEAPASTRLPSAAARAALPEPPKSPQKG